MTLEQECFAVKYHPAKFGGHRHFESKMEMFVVCQVISEGNVIKESSEFMDESSSW